MEGNETKRPCFVSGGDVVLGAECCVGCHTETVRAAPSEAGISGTGIPLHDKWLREGTVEQDILAMVRCDPSVFSKFHSRSSDSPRSTLPERFSLLVSIPLTLKEE